jgi:hypothetical protein
MEDLLGSDVLCCGAPSLYNEDPRPIETELRESLQMAVEDD